MAYPVVAGGISGETIRVENTGRDSNLSVRPGEWVELDRGTGVATQSAPPLLRVTRVDLSRNEIFVKDKVTDGRAAAVLRRWDHKALAENRGGAALVEGAVPLREGAGEANWIPLENGIEVQFQRKETDPKNSYRTGDYWLIPARTAHSGQIDWPSSTDEEPDFVLPNGIRHRYAPLAAIQFSNAPPMICNMRKTMGLVVDIQAP